MFVNKLFTYLTCVYLKSEIFNILFSYEDEDIGRFLFSQKLSILCFPLNVSVFVQVHFRMQIIKSDTLT